MTDIEIAIKYANKFRSSVDRGISFTLTFSEYKKLITAKTCYYTKVRLNPFPGYPNTLTIDRIDASKGYIKGNCVTCAADLNAKKKDLTIAEIEMLYHSIQKLKSPKIIKLNTDENNRVTSKTGN